MSRGFDKHIEKLSSQGLLTEDPDGMFCGGSSQNRSKRFLIQLDGGQLTKPYWTEETSLSASQYVREKLKDHPDAMVLKTEYV